MKKVSIQLEELVCPMCGQKIENALKKEAGVASCTVSYNSSKAKIEYDETQIAVDRMKSIIEDLGYIIVKVK